MSTEPTLPLPGAGAPGRFPPPTDPWSADAWSTPVPPSSAPGFPTSDSGSLVTPTGPPPVSAVPISGTPVSGTPIPGPPVSGTPLPGPPVSGTPIPGAPPVAGAPAAGPVLVQIGEIAVTSTMVFTPAGQVPLHGSTWHLADYWQSEQRTPRWAIVAAIVGFCVLTVLSLLFLLVKETVHRGTVQVTVGNGPWQYVARIPVTAQHEVQQLHQRVNYARSLAVAG